MALSIALVAVIGAACGAGGGSVAGSARSVPAPSSTPVPASSASTAPTSGTTAGPTPAAGNGPAPSGAPGSCHARGSGLYVLPDPACTPGETNPAVTQADIGSTICASGWTDTVRPPESYTEPLKFSQKAAYGEPGPVSAYEEDHLIPLELGGAPSDARNLWPEPGPAPNPKDEVENAARRAVCDGELSLAAAQQAIATDWIALGRQLGVTSAPSPAAGQTASPATAVAPASPAPVTAAGCTPTTPSGTCYRPGEYCSGADHGMTGTDAGGNTITCEDVNGTWRWE